MRADCLFGADQTPSRALTAASPLCHPGPTQGECLSCGARVAVVPGELPGLWTKLTIPPPMITIGFCLLSQARRDILPGVKASAYAVFGGGYL